MNILVVNCGSSSLKFQLINMEKRSVLAKGICDKIGLESSFYTYKCESKNVKIEEQPVKLLNHTDAIKVILEKLVDSEIGAISSLDEIKAIGHRIVQGGEKLIKATIVTQEVLEEIDSLSPLAPLHNPGALMGIRACMEVLKDKKNVTVFDTAFHQTLEEEAYLYAIPRKYYENYGIRKYGYHGTSYKYVLNKLASVLNKDKKDINCIICHLGSGASICAIKDGKSYDTTMGLTPLGGLIMGTRSGDMDPAVATYIMQKENMSAGEVNEMLNKSCGIKCISEKSSDARELVEASKNGDAKANLALRMFARKVKMYIGGYMAELGKLDALVFTGGIGENNSATRQLILKDLDILGFCIDESKNEIIRGKEGNIAKEDSKYPIYIIPTNEELEIAVETMELIK